MYDDRKFAGIIFRVGSENMVSAKKEKTREEGCGNEGLHVRFPPGTMVPPAIFFSS
ncbi:hypothetical protein SBA5_470094 [Candidatus Sulfotelmatomonas gaucii]|uniref:Uncharacterized protein n=1 Tax=Candidatus Sulfuritelmatomonas gaucii TaxID=2043161 RepID=A0A2N9LPG6_9BACT|nr:hypothetical protein SBA5_470094 [Candidatus Sulfotelmatomonas gaucii]